GLLLGFLSQEIAFGRLEVELSQSGSLCALWQNFESVRLPPGGTFISDWACIHAFDLDATHAFDHYLELVASVGDVGRIRESISGWCSWYYYGQDISNEDMRQEFDWITDHRDRLPLDLFQIDDGYQTNIGDWEQHDERFPEPLAYFSSDIRAASLTPGLWMAPLIASGDSKLMAQHPEWLLRDGRGKPVSAGFGWGRFFHALDGSHPGFIYEMKTWVGRAVSDWGFDYLKLDFLYAGALPGQRYDDTKTGAMVLRDVLEVIRFAAGDHTFLVGCGCPVGTGLGLVDSMRISPDVSEHWRGRYKGIPLLVSRDPGFPSAWNAIRNTYYRAHQHRLWWLNDPDCLILRSGNSSLSEDEMQSLVTMIALGGGVILDSDRLCALSDDRKAILARLIPPINRRPIQPTFFQPEKPAILVQHFEGAVGKWSLVAIFNFEETPKKTTLQRDLLGIQTGGIISGFDFWDQRILHFDGMSWDIGSIPAHGVKLLALRAQNGGPLWIGDTIHISQGNCVSEWSDKDNKLFAVIESGRIGTEKIWLDIPGTVRSVTIDGEPIDDIEYQDGMILFEIQLEHHNKLALEWR
ncbi:MAG: alpha-galactosidase, partial [Anaerolineales bacterium]